MDISQAPGRDRKNKVWKRSMHAGSTLLHPDFGPPNYGIPFDVVDGSHPTVHVDFGYDDESDPGPYPFGPDIQVEGGSDRHANMIDRDTCTLYELFAAEWNGGEPTAGSGAIFHLERTARERPASGDLDVGGRGGSPDLPRAWSDGTRCEAGAIEHAIRFTVSCTSRHVRVAGAASGGEQRRPLPADGRAVPAQSRVRHVAATAPTRRSSSTR